MKKVIFLSILTTFSFLKASDHSVSPFSESHYNRVRTISRTSPSSSQVLHENPYGRKAALRPDALPRLLHEELDPSFWENLRANGSLLGIIDSSCRKLAYWGFDVSLNGFQKDVTILFGKRVIEGNGLGIGGVAPATVVDKQKLALALFGSEPTKVESKFSKPVDVKIRTLRCRTSHTTPYRIQTEERRKKMAECKYLKGYQHASASFSPSRKTGRPAQLFRKYNNQPKHKHG